MNKKGNILLTGYEKETIEEFIYKLIDNNVKAVIDVREIPLSRKYGFSKIHLKRELNRYNIKYFHLPELGSPTNIRKDLKTNRLDYLEFFKRYREYLQNKNDVLENLANIATNEETTALLCYEKCTELCHRSIIANEMTIRYPQFQITPI